MNHVAYEQRDGDGDAGLPLTSNNMADSGIKICDDNACVGHKKALEHHENTVRAKSKHIRRDFGVALKKRKED